MIDSIARPFLAPHIDGIAAKAVQGGLSANKLTLIAFGFGCAGCFAVGMAAYPFGLLLMLLNRFIRGLASSAAGNTSTALGHGNNSGEHAAHLLLSCDGHGIFNACMDSGEEEYT